MIGISYKFEPFFELLRTDKETIKKYKDIRYVILVGGRGSGKSHALTTWINQASYKKGWGQLVTRWTMVSAETSIIPEFKKQCDTIKNRSDFNFIRARVLNNCSQSVIDYKGIKPQSNEVSGALKSVSGKNIFIVEEAEDCHNFELFDKIDNSIRTTDNKNIIILCLNQGHINHWIYKEFIEEKRDDTLVIETTYLDNIKHLDESFIKKAERVKQRDYAKYEHIYLNKWQTSTDGALWKKEDISAHRMTLEEYKREYEDDMVEIVVAYDPAVTDFDKTEKERNNQKEPDEDGIIIVTRDRRNHFYVLRDISCRGKRSELAKKLVGAYKDSEANYIIIENNNGGDWIPSLIKTVDKHVRIKTVHAQKGKKIRAQPVQAVYEEGEVHHIGHFPELEYEMTTWIPDIGMKSPNRLDAMVWGITHLCKPQKQFRYDTV